MRQNLLHSVKNHRVMQIFMRISNPFSDLSKYNLVSQKSVNKFEIEIGNRLTDLVNIHFIERYN